MLSTLWAAINPVRRNLKSILVLFVRYIAPLIPRRVAGDLRKRAIIRGTFGEFSYPAGQRFRRILLHDAVSI
jgi:hypothetical protein